MAAGDEDEEEDGGGGTVEPPYEGVTEKSNDSRSSQILYVITSSPGKPDHSMPGQWPGRSRTCSPSESTCVCVERFLLPATRGQRTVTTGEAGLVTKRLRVQFPGGAVLL